MFMYISYLILIIFNIIKSKKALHMLQQNLYNTNNRYLKWLNKYKKAVFINLEVMAIILLIIGLFFNKFNLFLGLYLIIYVIEAYIIYKKEKREQVKKPLVVTSRLKRLIVTLSIIYLIPLVLGILNVIDLKIMLIMLSLLIYFNYIMVYIAKIINIPIEKYVYKYFENKALKKLRSLTNLKVIGITGSYGKTSSKNILSEILNEKYIARPTPKNLNTEYGMMITINEYLDKFDEFLIAEMGAYTSGEIKTLCDMVKPKYGIITTIGIAHLESFGSEENIIKTKFELVEALPSDGACVLNGDDPKQLNYKINNDCKKIWIGIKNTKVDYYATNIKCSHKGVSFDLNIKNDNKTYPFETKLLGTHNIYNILASIALGFELGMNIKDLQLGVKKVKPIESRLELRNYGYMYQINDAYNSNPVGAKEALNVLSLMPGAKFVVTPGMTELGEKEEKLNEEFGEYISESADYVILVGKKRTEAIYRGLMNKKYNKENIFIVNSVYEAYNILQEFKTDKDIYALFENDLPDIYNE